MPFNPFQFLYDFGIGFLEFMQTLWDAMQIELITIGDTTISVYWLVLYQVGGILVALIVANIAKKIIALR